MVAFATTGQPYDIAAFARARDDLVAHGLDFYSFVNVGNWHWPYLPGFLPWVLIAGAIADATPLPFHGLIQIPAIAADALIAWFVYDYLRRHGSSYAERTVGMALVAFGPTFALVSGYHGQIDSVAILPAVAAAWYWDDRAPDSTRSIVTGLLLGIAAAIKTVPGVILLAFIARAATWRQRVLMMASAVALPAALVLPFFVADPRATAAIRNYRGWPGQGGITLLLQPGLAKAWLLGPDRQRVRYSSATTMVVDNGEWIVVGLLVLVGATLLLRPMTPVHGAIVVVLALCAFGPGYFYHYMVWVLPFLVMAGYLRYAAALQVLLTIPMVLYYAGPWDTEVVVGPYVAVMVGLWITWVVVLVSIVATSGTGRRGPVRVTERPGPESTA